MIWNSLYFRVGKYQFIMDRRSYNLLTATGAPLIFELQR